MTFREATVNDIKQMQAVRNAVKENTLSDPGLITDQDYEVYMTERGKAWVCEFDKVIIGFAYVDTIENNIWALFVSPEFAGKGIGKNLHKIMLDWYFSVTDKKVWLSTSPNTRAETFYRKQGWIEAGLHGKELRFEMTSDNWKFKN